MRALPRRFSFALITLVLLVLTPPALAAAKPGPPRVARGERDRTVVVKGTGQVRAQPDLAAVTLGVETRAASAKEALEENSRRVRAVLRAAREAGVAKGDVATRRVAIEPVYTPPRGGDVARLAGYRVENQVLVTVRDLDGLGALLDTVVRRGANQVLGLEFQVGEAEVLNRRARELAMQDAELRARQLAELAGAKLGPVQRIREADAAPAPRSQIFALPSRRGGVPIEPGAVEVRYEVTVRYALQ